MGRLTKPGVLALVALFMIAVSTIAEAQRAGRHHGGHHRGHHHHGHSHSHFGLGFVFGAPLWYGYGYGYGAPVYPAYAPYAYAPYPAYVPHPAYTPYYAGQAPVYVERGDVAVVPREGGPVWYYCRDTDLYYPYARQCPGSWERVPAQPVSR